MGHPLILQALPEDSRLFARLQEDPQVGTLVAQLFNSGSPYTWASQDGILDGIMELGSVFATRQEVDRAMKRLLSDLEEARALHPGLETQRVFLDKTQWDIEERLVRKLEKAGHPGAGEFVRTLLFGATPLTPPGVEGPLGDGLRVVRSARVAEAAVVLRGAAPHALFDDRDWREQEFRSWRGLYLAAAERGEAVVVGD